MATLFDVDKLAAEFEPVEIRFRGEKYTLGSTVESVMAATREASSVADDAPLEEQMALLPGCLKALCGSLDISQLELTLGERLVLQKAVTEVMTRVGNVPFRPAD